MIPASSYDFFGDPLMRYVELSELRVSVCSAYRGAIGLDLCALIG